MVRIIAFLIALAALQFAAFAQSSAERAADAAEAVAARASSTFEPIDPDSQIPAADDAAAVYAGTVRRGFLKGVGLERGCKAPARP